MYIIFGMERKCVKLFGFDIDSFNFNDAVDYALELISSKKGGQVVTVNPEMIENALVNKTFADVLSQAELVVPDGIGIKIGLKMKGENVDRIAGVEFAYELLNRCSQSKIPVAFVGARPHVVLSAVKNMKAKFDNLKVVYYQNGYFSDEQRVLKELRQKSPKLVLVALGSPKQENFIKQARELLPASLFIGVGGSFDVWSGEVERAPKIYQNLGLEWLYRTVKEPKRFKRIFPTIPRFLLNVLKKEVFKIG